MSREIELLYVALSEVALWGRNPKKHDIGAIIESIRRHGFRDPPTFDRTLGALVAGNGRTAALYQMKQAGEDAPDGIRLRDDGEWLVPIKFGLDAKTVAQAEAYGVDHNAITVSGGDIGLGGVAALFDGDRLGQILYDLGGVQEPLAVFDGADIDTLLSEPPPPTFFDVPPDSREPETKRTCPHCGKEIDS